MSVKGEGLPGTPNQGVRKVEGQSALTTGATGGIGALPPPHPLPPACWTPPSVGLQVTQVTWF